MPIDINKQIYVALDLETTGLVPESDAIIEVGAVKFQNGHQIGVFQSLVNPHRPIPFNIQRLCGISQEDVDIAPPFSALEEKLASFLEGCHPVGHNVSFDLNFLARNGIGLPHSGYDTFELAKLILPDLPERSLSAVAKYLAIPHPSAHRALADAEVSKEVFTQLLNRLHELDPCILNELARLTARADWWLGSFIRQVAEERGTSILLSEGSFENACFGSQKRKAVEPLTPHEEKTQLNVKALTRFFEHSGSLARAFPNYEKRPEQVRMMQAVAEALNESQHLIVEAGTGTGKSMAYLLPALLFAHQNNIPVVVSTNTINLQEQLVHKDIPDLLQAIGPDSDQSIPAIQVVQVKGRTNYLCVRRWDTLRRAEGLSLDMIQLLARIQVWLPTTETGDRSEINIDSREVSLWFRLCAQSYDCLGRQCPYQQRGLCFLHRVRKAAEGAHLIVINHALLLSEMASGVQILPEYDHLIIDEAHHLEGVATDQLGVEIRERDIFDHLDQIILHNEDQRMGFVPQLEVYIRSSELFLERKSELEQLNRSLSAGAARAGSRVSEFFNELGQLLQNYGEGQGEYDLNLRITRAMRAQPAWADIEISCENLLAALGDIARTLRKIDVTIEDLASLETLRLELLSLVNSNEELRRQMDSLVFHPDENTIHWLTLGRKSNMITLCSAPLHVGTLLQESLYALKNSLVLTGATLSTEGNFSYLKGRLSLEYAEELLLGSPFDYPNAAMVYLASDIPEPGRAGYQETVGRALIPLCRAASGRCLVLFTSHAALRAAQAAIAEPLAEDGISVLAQGLDGMPRKLLNSLASNPRTVLLGAASFWEGVDIVGDALSVLVIVRLPFNVPSDPVFAARSETFENPFAEYALPQTAFRFKQGFGRLIRSKTDRGLMLVLDSRLSNRNYSSVFLNSLPPCQVEKGHSRNLPRVIKSWLGN